MRFLVHVKIQPDAPQEEIAEQLPAEQARFAELVEQGVISKSKSNGRSKWSAYRNARG
ncbi:MULTISPECIES: hypothetical protein [Paenibacillus]|uniref:hypothetical protein n=1 Tax=Paenibacillus TaxID=44249 RepID=UPI0013EBBE9B|nr:MULTISPECIES: hypothetical protein [Paenibacillus]KAF6579781.1 hypothetical protein G9G54_06200 [Paenibacillus sp. EKM212P]MCP3781209.1 hypothetical protein [Paenibacillus sp. MZ03-122A]MCP3793966.1 hypothetical protein [Paenibacillus sp. CH40]MDY8047444.1 hypothetical protein [Paenibacillus polymyxa]